MIKPGFERTTVGWIVCCHKRILSMWRANTFVTGLGKLSRTENLILKMFKTQKNEEREGEVKDWFEESLKFHKIWYLIIASLKQNMK